MARFARLRYTTPQPGTERFAVGEAFNPHRVMINLDGTGRDMNYDGWRHKTHFYAYPNQKSHVAAIGQAQSNLWGLPHLSGLLERAFWSLVIYARNSRVMSQTERRERVLKDVENEIAQQQSALHRLQSQEKRHEAALQRDTSEWRRTIEDTEDLLYQSCMQKTSNAKGFTKEIHEIRNKSTEYKIVGAKLRSDMDALLTQQRARKAKSDAVLAERAKQRIRDAERKQQEFLDEEARKREAQRIADSHRLEKIVAQGRGELDKFLNETESAKAEAKLKQAEPAEPAAQPAFTTTVEDVKRYAMTAGMSQEELYAILKKDIAAREAEAAKWREDNGLGWLPRKDVVSYMRMGTSLETLKEKYGPETIKRALEEGWIHFDGDTLSLRINSKPVKHGTLAALPATRVSPVGHDRPC